MSQLCLIEIKDYDLSYKEMDNLSKELVLLAAKENIGIHFNVNEYCKILIDTQEMNFFCIVSSSFLHYNADFLDFPFSEEWLIENKERFVKKYHFLLKILKKVFSYDVKLVNLYLSEDGLVEIKDDFIYLTSTLNNLLEDMYQITIDCGEETQYNFPSICIEVIKKNN